MSICLYIKHASEIDLARYRRDGVALADLQGAGDDRNEDFTLAELEAQERIFAAREAAGRVDPRYAQAHRAAKARISRRLMEKRGVQGGTRPKQPAVLDLHKSWHVLHFAFTGEASGGALPNAMLLAGGTMVGRDLGYGRARIVDPASTHEFATFLSSIDNATLEGRLDPAKMRSLRIYGASQSRAPLRDEVVDSFSRLRDHIKAADEGRLGLLIWMM